MISTIPQVFAAWARVLKPRPKRNIWQWADESRFLAKGVSAKSRHGTARYETKDAPHQRGVMESFTDPQVRTTVMIGASQVMGKTEMINNCIGYHMDYKPCNVIVMYPTVEGSEKYSKKKFMPMCRATPCLDSLLQNSRSRDSGNTILVKEYTGGSIFLVGANSPASLRGASGEILIADEIDTNADEAGNEGDAVRLLMKRGDSFPSVVQILSSTPTEEGSSRIWAWFEMSDQRFWFVPCPHCSTWGIFKWSPQSIIKAGPSFFMDWPEGKPQLAAIVCATCAKSINDEQRREAYYNGEWRPTAPFNGIRGFHFNWMYSPWKAKKSFSGGMIHQMAQEWEDSKGEGATSLKVLINASLCETWKIKLEDAPDWKVLLERREPYATPIPAGVVYLTCAVDTQSDRLEYEICGWGIGEECWGIKTGKIFGSPFTAAPWQKLEEDVLNATFAHPNGATLRISCTLIDSGGQSDEKAFTKPVYAFVLRRQGRHVYACKGSSTLGAPLVIGHLQKNRILLQNIGTDVAKSMIYERAGILTPGPGFYHWSADEKAGYGEEYFQQFTAESIQLLKGKRVWVKTRARNEALDLRVYNHAAFEIRNVNLEAVARSIQPKEAPKPVPITEIPGLVIKPAVPAPPPKPVTRFRRRIGFSGW